MFGSEQLSVPRDFGRAVEALWARDGIVVDGPAELAEMVATSFASGGDGTRAASDALIRSGVRARWNDVLRRERAEALARRIQPLLIEPAIDVLSGDGSITRALSDLGIDSLMATERLGEYSESVLPATIPFYPYNDAIDLAAFDASTALISTVLHHEVDPVALLNTIAKTNIRRWIVVENCVTPQYSKSFHQFADRFFNNCLNEFGVACVEQHRTLEEWVDLLTVYGTVTVIDDAFAVPGIPFPYSLLVVERDRASLARP